MKLALIPPFELLEYTAETSCQLMLPHLLKNEAYRYTYTRLCEEPEQYVILDNGEAEGESFDNETLINMALDYGADELVIPDTIRNMKETRDKARAFHDEFEKRQFHHKDWPLNLMFVAQGENISEFFASAIWAATEPWIDVIGLPRHMIETCGALDVRREMAYELADETSKPIHLLGGSPLNPMELCDSWPEIVRSTDTSSPFNYAYAQMKLDGNGGSAMAKRPEGYFDLPWEQFEPELVKHNVRQLMDWTRNDL